MYSWEEKTGFLFFFLFSLGHLGKNEIWTHRITSPERRAATCTTWKHRTKRDRKAKTGRQTAPAPASAPAGLLAGLLAGWLAGWLGSIRLDSARPSTTQINTARRPRVDTQQSGNRKEQKLKITKTERQRNRKKQHRDRPSKLTNRDGRGIRLNGSQCGGCSTNYDTPSLKSSGLEDIPCLTLRGVGDSKKHGKGKIPPVTHVESVSPFAHAAAYATTTSHGTRSVDSRTAAIPRNRDRRRY